VFSFTLFSLVVSPVIAPSFTLQKPSTPFQPVRSLPLKIGLPLITGAVGTASAGPLRTSVVSTACAAVSEMAARARRDGRSFMGFRVVKCSAATTAGRVVS
jgi:hypothetical protein